MTTRTAASNKAQYKYNAKHYKRVPLDYPIAEYEDLKQAAKQAGESVNGFIKQAIKDRIAKQAGDK